MIIEADIAALLGEIRELKEKVERLNIELQNLQQKLDDVEDQLRMNS